LFVIKYHDGIEFEHGKDSIAKLYKSEARALLKVEDFRPSSKSMFMSVAKAGRTLAN